MLRGTHGWQAPGDGATELPIWVPPNPATAHARIATPLEKATNHIRELDERSSFTKMYRPTISNAFSKSCAERIGIAFRFLRKGPSVWPNSTPILSGRPIFGWESASSDEYRSRIDDLRRTRSVLKFLSLEPLLGPLSNLDLRGIDWVIVGGESGFKARVLDPAWATDLRDQCRMANVPFFFKQWGGRNKKLAGRVLDGEIWDQMPNDPSHRLDDREAQPF